MSENQRGVAQKRVVSMFRETYRGWTNSVRTALKPWLKPWSVATLLVKGNSNHSRVSAQVWSAGSNPFATGPPFAGLRIHRRCPFPGDPGAALAGAGGDAPGKPRGVHAQPLQGRDAGLGVPLAAAKAVGNVAE